MSVTLPAPEATVAAVGRGPGWSLAMADTPSLGSPVAGVASGWGSGFANLNVLLAGRYGLPVMLSTGQSLGLHSGQGCAEPPQGGTW